MGRPMPLSFNCAVTFSFLLSYLEFILLGNQRVRPMLPRSNPRVSVSIFPFLQQASVKILSPETSSPPHPLQSTVSQNLSNRFNSRLGRWDKNWQVHPLGTKPKLPLHKVWVERRGMVHN